MATLVWYIQGRCRGSLGIQGDQGGGRDRVWDEDWEIMMHELSIGELRDSIKQHTTVLYHPASNGVAERMTGVLIDAARTSHGRVQVGYR